MIWCRFYLPCNLVHNDYRPALWPIKYPYWCTGYTDDSFCIVAYLEDLPELFEQWPELHGLSEDITNLDWHTVDKIEFGSRFQCPDWYTDEHIEKVKNGTLEQKVYTFKTEKDKKSKQERFIEKFGHWWYIRDLDFLPQPCEDYMKAFKMDGKWLNLVNEGRWKAFNNLEEARKASNIIRKAMGMKEYIFK